MIILTIGALSICVLLGPGSRRLHLCSKSLRFSATLAISIAEQLCWATNRGDIPRSRPHLIGVQNLSVFESKLNTPG